MGGGGGGGLGAGLVSSGAVGNSLTSHIQALQFEPRSRSNVEKLVAAFFRFFESPDFHELWPSMMSICLFTEVKQQWATLVLGWVTASVHCSCLWWGLQLALVDENPFQPCFALFQAAVQHLGSFIFC